MTMYDHETGWAGRVMGWLRALLNLVLVNLLFVAGTAAGLLVLGFFPAAVAAQHVLAGMRGGCRGQQVAREFAQEYLAQFRRANLVGAPFWGVGLLLFLDAGALASGHLSGPGTAVLAALLPALGLYAVLVMLASVTIMAGRRDSAAAIWRYALALPLSSPGMSTMLVLAMAALALVLGQWTVLIPLVGASLPLFAAGWVIGHRLEALEAGTAKSPAATAPGQPKLG